MPAFGGFVILFVMKDSIYDVSFIAWPLVEQKFLSQPHRREFHPTGYVFQLKAGSVDIADRMTLCC